MRAFGRRGIAALLVALTVVSCATTLRAQNPNTQIQIAINNLVTGVTTFVRARFNPGGYILWGSGTDANGYGIRDSSGTIQWKNSGGSWADLGGGGGGGAPSDASYWVRTASSGLSNETSMGALATGLVKNTTTTGVPTIAVAADIIGLWTGSCNGSTVLAGNGTCIGTSGGAPSTSSYITQVPDAGLSAEQALSLLATGILKSTTSTGVISLAVSADVVSLWSGTCNGSTVLAGDGSCIAATGGAPTNGTYITQTPNGSLSAEQALSLLTTGLMKVTTSTGVVSVAAVGDITGLFSGTCNTTTVLTGGGTCVTPTSGGAPSTASYWTRIPDATLSNETALSTLATGIVKNTTATGVPSIATVTDILSLFTGTCNGSTVLAGNGTCITVSGGSGAPTTATYITQIPDAGLSAEQALSAIATGLLKVTTTTGVLTAANVSDILGYFTGTCNSSTVLAGDGTCITVSGGGAPTTATYLTQTPNGTLSNEQAMSLLATGLMKVTTTTGVVSAASVTDITSYFSGCSATLTLLGNGTCGARALTTSTFITQTPSSDLSAEQALSALATGLLKNTTGTGVLSAAAVADVTGLFSGTCNSSTVLTGGGTCVALSTAFSVISSATNSIAAMVIGTGASLTTSGSGTITATALKAGTGATQTCTNPVATVTVVNGIITAITCP